MSTPDPSNSSSSGPTTQTERSHSPSTSDPFPGLDSSYRTAVHPGLVAELDLFEGQLDARINQPDAFYPTFQQGSSSSSESLETARASRCREEGNGI